MKKKKFSKLIIISIILVFIIGCSKSIPNDTETDKNPTISVEDVVTTNMASDQDDTFTHEMTISINNSTEKFDTIKASFIRKVTDETSAILQLASVSLSNGNETIKNFDVTMNIGHYSKVE